MGLYTGLSRVLIVGLIKGDTRSLDYSSYGVKRGNTGVSGTWRVMGT